MGCASDVRISNQDSHHDAGTRSDGRGRKTQIDCQIALNHPVGGQ